ncbi:hypothetical protein AVEN_96434-1 [Araneus ventricosus]|uniref:Uncharacterized protein n=1 Tax=Araneus ventricosus TaxID=182803 RepID=A0A4Y2HX15_ARAVE|nr:hypothetical protein AVEN_96434-1 [Araneus ventricosus]
MWQWYFSANRFDISRYWDVGCSEHSEYLTLMTPATEEETSGVALRVVQYRNSPRFQTPNEGGLFDQVGSLMPNWLWRAARRSGSGGANSMSGNCLSCRRRLRLPAVLSFHHTGI